MALPILGQPALAPYMRAPFLAKGFRPFFLAAALFAALDMPLWLMSLAGLTTPVTRYFDPASWHAHELIFGFTGAVIAGFLLTAVANWTGRETLVGRPLAALAILWLAGRIALLLPLPPLLVAVIDLAFLPALAIAVGRPLIATRNRRNYAVLGVLSALFLANLAMHLDTFGASPVPRREAALFAVDVIAFLIAFIAARIFPTFTRNATGVSSIRNMPALDRLALAALGLVVILDVAVPGSLAAGVAAGVAAVLLFVRSSTWGALVSLKTPLLWVLHASHLFLVIGLGLRAFASITPLVPSVAATHALTVGALGLATLGMMARVALGHTGRPLKAPKLATVAFSLLLAAAIVRVAGATLETAIERASLHVSGALWSVAFTLYAIAYARTLLGPRADGKPG